MTDYDPSMSPADIDWNHTGITAYLKDADILIRTQEGNPFVWCWNVNFRKGFGMWGHDCTRPEEAQAKAIKAYRILQRNPI